ncbi:PAS domain S-box protein [Polyangium aurulentum]|uniref:PAS domain S-box protein n=1 Tax=Polyangium aurulentum TaxID=2567896 RepID=UPI0010AECC15|nr:PAS domain S-box protein [Polyangium aurulentum]UQA55417.1 PAS domain S-box protein [Polyangium aurulentum]
MDLDPRQAFIYRDFFEKSPGLHCVVGSDGRFEHVSPSWTRVTGLPREALIGQEVLDRIHPDDRAAFVAGRGAEGEVAHESRFRCADGSYRWLAWSVSFDADAGRTYGLARDIEPERRTAKDAARRLALYLERSPVAVIESTLQDGIVVWSAAAERMFGHRREEAIGKKLIDLLVPEANVACVRAAVAGLMSGEDAGGRFGVHENLTKDGRRIFCEWHNAPLVGEDGEVRGVLSLVLDVSEAMRERARADENLERYELLMRGSKNGLWDYRPANPHQPLDRETLVYMSDGILGMLGRSSEDADAPRRLGDWGRVIHPEDAQRVMAIFLEHIQKRKDYTYLEYRFVRPDGSIVWVGSTWQSQWSEDGGLLRFAGALVDLSEQRKTEAELRDKLALIERQAGAIRQLGTPILEVYEGVICLPVIGEVDDARGIQMLEATLAAIVEKKASFLILDVTGVASPDSQAVERLSFIVRAAALLGAETVITGIRAAVALGALSNGGSSTEHLRTLRSLKEGLAFCLRARTLRGPNVGGPKARPTR